MEATPRAHSRTGAAADPECSTDQETVPEIACGLPDDLVHMAMILLWVMALAVVASLMPAFVVGLRHSIASGRHASEREARDPYF